jgi:hypothetical protein
MYTVYQSVTGQIKRLLRVQSHFGSYLVIISVVVVVVAGAGAVVAVVE